MSSPIDDLYERIYGSRPRKAGTAYEMLAAAVCKLFAEADEIFHDNRMRGEISGTLYQVDVLLQKGKEKYFGEAKDYTKQKKSPRTRKVGRGDLQKLVGALSDLSVKGAFFFSATGYTGPAKKYAKNFKKMTGKDITLFHLSPSVELDENGQIKEIRITMHRFTMNFDEASLKPILTEEAQNRLVEKASRIKRRKDQNIVPLGDALLDTVFDVTGAPILNVEQVLLDQPAQPYGAVHWASIPTPGGYIKVKKALFSIHGLTYKIPINETTELIVIPVEGKAKLLLTNEDGSIKMPITEKDLRRVRFLKDGTAVIAD
jgi:hypothetical protein